MAHRPEIKSLLSFLDENYQALKDAEDTLNPKLENHVTNVMNVKRNLEDLRKEIIKYKREEEDIDVGKKNLAEVYHAMTLAENFLFPEDYTLDKLMYKLLKIADDDKFATVTSYKEVVEDLTVIRTNNNEVNFIKETTESTDLVIKVKVDPMEKSFSATNEDDIALKASSVEKILGETETSPDVVETISDRSSTEIDSIGNLDVLKNTSKENAATGFTLDSNNEEIKGKPVVEVKSVELDEEDKIPKSLCENCHLKFTKKIKVEEPLHKKHSRMKFSCDKRRKVFSCKNVLDDHPDD